MNAQQFKAGDQVMLRSGGPYMTVERVNGDTILCVWFHEQELKHASFGAALLCLREDVETEQAAVLTQRYERLGRISQGTW
ncbi:YodC family protein [Sphingomonas oryzagri]